MLTVTDIYDKFIKYLSFQIGVSGTLSLDLLQLESV